MGSNVHPVAYSADAQIFSKPATVYGWSLRETGGLAFVVLLRDGDDATDPIRAIAGGPANDPDTQWFGPQGLRFNAGVFTDLVAGTTVEGVIFIG